MLTRYTQLRIKLSQLLDACLTGLALAVAYLIRTDERVMSFLRASGVSPFSDYLILLLITIAITPPIFEASKLYERLLTGSRVQMLFRLARACLGLTLTVVVVAYLFKLSLGRIILIMFGVFSFLLIWLKEEALRLLIKSRFGKEQSKIRILAVGSSESRDRVITKLSNELGEWTTIVGTFDPVHNLASRLNEIIQEKGVDCLVISCRDLEMDKVEEVVRLAETQGVECYLMVDFLDTRISKPGFTRVGGVPMLVFRTGPEPSWQTVVKQVFDFIVALVALIVLLPVFLIIAILIKLTSPGPVFFKQLRCGLNGRPFVMYKFRTMYPDAEQRKRELLALNEMSGPVFKLSNDPRVTPIGKVLRKFSLDELPQLINVLKGEMSLVGPRPLPVEEVKQFDQLWYRRRMSVKPGLTCLWQIRGRNEIRDFKEWARLDLEYIDNWSLWLDFKILLKTIPAVIKAVGAK